MAEKNLAQAIVATLLDQRDRRIERGFYWENQIAFVYNSEKMEGSPLTKEQTRTIFETGTITGRSVNIDSVLETKNHFSMFDYMLDTLHSPLTKELIKKYHCILKTGTKEDLEYDDIAVGGWKLIPNAVGGLETTPPSRVEEDMDKLLQSYAERAKTGYKEIAEFHVWFETIHPFQDGNGRVGRALMFRECVVNGLEPFIVLDEQKETYYQGLSVFNKNPEKLIDFFKAMSDLYLIAYTNLIPEHLLLPREKEFEDLNI